MNSYIIGFGAAVLGNVVIGAGQCMQKYALNRLQREWEAQREIGLEGGDSGLLYNGGTSTASAYVNSSYPAMLNASALDMRSRSGSLAGGPRASGHGNAIAGSTAPFHTGDGPRARYTSKTWMLGLVLNYTGEIFGNSVALSYLSASVVAPLGIISVLVNLVLAEKFIGERITPNQRYGFMVIMAGVGLILMVAPRRSAASDAVQFVELVSTSGILGLFGILYVVQAALIYLIRTGHQSLFLYVLVASLFGSMNVMVSKILTMFMRLKLTFSAIPNPADIIFYGATQAPQAKPLLLYLTGPQILAAVVMGLSIIGQESFRQQALGKYSVMQFQPVFFATYNIVATLSGLLLFKELDGLAHALLFFSVFSVGIVLILYGSKFLQKAKAVVLPSHIRLHKENLGLKTL
ncbi:hypothetical protein GGI25_006112 [Coemansia spiralis]|uniref:Uncharacterized protein n=2 Tax=Coemansia TaxID=4863 RepID=A0A9W8G2Q4_9FUNG|nr:magnesium transporter NIPA-domain-containing protein [Coemansia spiralis]KAJ1986963.1 hypothetical protein EDC05_006066 [Coemansia umbellata]KAJ2618996.1 hypothetical protein GGI26_006185 [Coemansia sp. RSA 1358]KAJ2669534.1 hypothetical protein GGI25_006112 [Coemansia spiralis]